MKNYWQHPEDWENEPTLKDKITKFKEKIRPNHSDAFFFTIIVILSIILGFITHDLMQQQKPQQIEWQER